MDLRWDAVTVDALDAERLATFWSGLLGVEVRGRWEQYVGLHPARPGLPRLVFQQVAGRSDGKPALHLDLHVPDAAALEEATQRAVSLGATQTAEVEQEGQRWRVLADPEGNPFCLVSDNG
jgi:catechol 2,3-dioxygenase-like lactoylglutathione lyase family enzyme